ALERRIAELERESHERAELAATRMARRKFAMAWLGGGLLIAAALGAGGSLSFANLSRIGLISRWTFHSATLAAWTALLLCWVWLTARAGAANPAIANWELFSRLLRFKYWLLGTLGAVLIGAVGNALYEWMKQRL